MYGGGKQFLPLRVNHGGVMPIIFAQSLMLFPGVILGKADEWTGGHNGFIAFLNGEFKRGAYLYILIELAMIYFFAYFWTTVQFQPKEMATQLRDYGSFIQGLRPGKRTAEYLESVMMRITYVGAAFLCIVAVIPNTITAWLGIDPTITSFLGGTGLLIVVSVALDMVQRIEANLLMRNYSGFMGPGGKRIQGPPILSSSWEPRASFRSGSTPLPQLSTPNSQLVIHSMPTVLKDPPRDRGDAERRADRARHSAEDAGRGPAGGDDRDAGRTGRAGAGVGRRDAG